MDEITAIRTGIELTNRINLFLPFAANRAIDRRFQLVGKSGQYRAMHPAISGGISTNAEKYVEVTESATENNYSAFGGEKMKMWGKSPQLLMVTSFAGKPCMLKCHV